MRFPKVSGANLLRQKKHLPEDFEGLMNVVLIAFWQSQQSDVDTWLPPLERWEKTCPGLEHYELPTISSRGRLAQFWIDEGMRMGIPDPQTRAHTITLYLEKAAFRRALEIESEDEITVLLLDGQGEVIWRGRGVWDADQGQALQSQIEAGCARL
ncbi:hypothetical protein [Ornatilinea apprima]|uniref:hypothetical protein n=1 Tax=Ornatilinea apprima TaxID=1134406 RepID=UPI00094633B4|nr:hypothetical protein [Ornatilinea apprima]